MIKYDVGCVSCCGVFVETTKEFNPDRPATGNMFTLKAQPKEFGWESFPEYDSTDHPDIVCPSCGSQYCDSTGKVIRLSPIGEFEDGIETLELAVNPFLEASKPAFNEEGRAKCPHCGEMVNRQWWGRHSKKHE